MQANESLGKPRVLIVDDEEPVLRVHSRILAGAGYHVETAIDGEEAGRALEQASFDVILSDIDMPKMNGMQLLERVRARDLDVPVIVITGRPEVDTAMQAMKYGALRYLVKPVALEELVKVTNDGVRWHKIAKAKREALELAGGVDRFTGDRAGLAASLERAMASLFMVYQPIVRWSTQTVYAYEALLRTREPSLPHPGAVLDAAERLGRVHDLGRLIRERAVQPREPLADGVLLFLNLHPEDLMDEKLFLPTGALAGMAGSVILEITERASLDAIRDVRVRIASLRKLGFRIAIDDLGAGYAGLTSFTLLEPDVVKLDMALVRDIDKEPKKQTVVRTLIKMCTELGIIVTSEGIETPAEREELRRAGCDLMQGYLFAKPGDAFPAPSF